VEIYGSPVRQILTFVIPVGLIFTLPANALLAGLPPFQLLMILTGAGGFYWLMLQFWHYALKKYSSASS
jgi:ABC-2 type transport system permease protein